MLRLPLDLSIFKEIRENGYLYVDKTRHAYTMITQGRYYFLSRPRRFGKSLLVSMLQELLAGRRELFKGLWIDSSEYVWQEHGIIMLDFSSMDITDADSFHNAIKLSMQKVIQKYNLTIDLSSLSAVWALHLVVEALHQKFGKVAILIDEYDNPILHALQDISRAEEIRDTMQRFFAAIKGLGAYLNFVFITGISSFAKAGLFSGMNNLRIITLNPQYADICGYTQEELDNYFIDYLEQWARAENASLKALQDKVKEFYNGYSFGINVSKVYNPFSLMHALDTKQFQNYWIESARPTFLMHELKKEYRMKEYRLFDPEAFKVNKNLIESFDIDVIPLPTLMFQAGYLTIVNYDAETGIFSLGYPNAEVQESMQKYLTAVFTLTKVENVERASSELETALQNENIETAVELLRGLFMHVPYQLHMKEEKFYHALLHMIFNTYGMQVVSEQAISHGRIDLIVALKNLLYVIEVKFNDTPENALKQIEEMKYYVPFMKEGKNIILLGLSFNRSERQFNITYAYRIL